MKKYIIVIIIMLYCIIDVVPAKAEEYEKTTAYRYTFLGNDNGAYYDSNWVNWHLDNPWNFTDNNTDNMQFTNRYNYQTTAVTLVNMVSNSDGHLYFKGRKVSGSAGDISLQNINYDYFYRYPSDTTTVQTNYTVTFKFDNPQNIQYAFFRVYVMGINRTSGNTTLVSMEYSNNPTGSQYAFGNSYTYAGNDGYNYKGFIVAMDVQVIADTVMLNDSMYELWKYQSNLETYTPEIDYTGQLANIGGTLSGILNSITSGFSSISTTISNLPTTIITGIKNLFIYDDWQEDVEDINSQVSVPFVTDITNSFTSIMSAFTSYNPYYQETLRCPNLMTSSPQYLFTVDLDLSRILGGNAIGNYKWIDLIRIATSFGSLAVYYSIIRKLLLKLGIDINDFISPIIRKVGNV